MQHLLAEHRVALIDLARQQGVSVSTVWRWTMRGLKGIRLETFTVGGRRYTSREAFDRFILRCQSPPVPNGARCLLLDREHQDAESHLESEGI